jgi:hypothetical protein
MTTCAVSVVRQSMQTPCITAVQNARGSIKSKKIKPVMALWKKLLYRVRKTLRKRLSVALLRLSRLRGRFRAARVVKEG